MRYLVVLLGTFLIGCHTNQLNNQDSNITSIDLSEIENEKTIQVKKGQKIVVKANENPSTGHSWETATEPNCIASLDEGEYTRTPVAEGIVGSGGTRTYQVSIVDNGTCTITFDYVGPGSSKKIAYSKKLKFISK